MRPPFEDKLKKDVEMTNYDASKHNPVFYGKMYERVMSVDADVESEFDPSVSHPACVRHVFVEPATSTPPKAIPQLPDKDKCKYWTCIGLH